MFKVASSLCVLTALATVAPPKSLASESYDVFDNGVEVRVMEGRAPSRISIRLDTSLGTDSEDATGGGAAAFLAALLKSGTPTYETSKWMQVVLDSGLSLTPHLERGSSGFTVSGGEHLLERALWLVGERLKPLHIKEADVRKIRPATFQGAESTKYQALTARGGEFDTLAHLLLGPRAGRSDFESRLRAMKLSSNAFRKKVDEFQRRVRPKITVVIPASRSDLRDTLGTTYFGSLPARELTRTAETQAKATTLDETVRARFENPRDSASIVGFAWNLSQLRTNLGWSRLRLETTAEVLVALMTHPGGRFHESIHEPSSEIIDFKAELTGTHELALVAFATCQARAFSIAKMAIGENMRRLTGTKALSELPQVAHSRVYEQRAMLHVHENLASVAGLLWTTKRVEKEESVGNWIKRYLKRLKNVRKSDVATLAKAIMDAEGRVEAKFVPSRSVRSREVGLTDEIMEIYERIVTDSRCPRPGTEMKWTELLQKKYRMSAETYVRISQKITARAHLMRRISKAADEQCEQYHRLRKVRSYGEIATIHRSISCGPASIRDFDLRQKAMKRVFQGHDLDPSLYKPLLAMAREDVLSRSELVKIERKCPPKYGPGVKR